ncbi:PstS family phosphate ABC transporter substrate-binding protein [Microseira wollei]|uniref:Periplasmic phosphate-binding protein of phosphate ABC transporter n=1 Tax=Microseira wollei NIES-4236 TaxID=2530354 RepID=A0AAV3WNV2_9CYAN|nr:substrate-binding domain-containing protein [Microseira wollei]GET43554.1 periplasmic phosphate-binding protein of phosphate ABC transporter [Microseira wollei NIES-4236]
MTQKNETTVLVLALLITTGLVGLGFWWFTSKTGSKTDSLINQESSQSDQANLKTFTQVKNVPSGLFSYGGSTTWATIRRDLDPAIQTVWPQFRLRYTHPNQGTPSTGSGIRMLLDNQLSFSHASRPIEDKEYEQAKQRGFTLVEIPVAIDGRAIGVHPSLNIPGITMQQRDDIYAGKITNWNQLGGPNLRIQRYAVQGDEGENLEIVPTPTEAIRKVAEDPAGMFEASAPLLVSQCKVKTLSLGRSYNQLIPPYKQPFVPLSECPSKRNEANTEAFLSGEYPLTRRLFVVVKKNNQIDQQAGEAYAQLLLTEQGQEMIEKAGFVRIR